MKRFPNRARVSLPKVRYFNCLVLESQSRNLALTALFVPHSHDSGINRAADQTVGVPTQPNMPLWH